MISTTASSSSSTTSKKPCCDCPITKQARDECMLKNGDEKKCEFLIAAHNLCMGYVSKDTLIQRIQSDVQNNPRTPTKKICCSCPDTKRVRDDCVAKYGPDNEDCQYLIEGHKLCLRNEGFQNV
jgi:cytochrome c oxidase assembly protein subunit 17